MTKKLEDRYLNLLEKGFADLKSEVKENTKTTYEVLEQAKYTNGRVTKLEETVYKNKPSAEDLPPFYRDPKLINVGLILAIALLMLISAATNIDIPGINL